MIWGCSIVDVEFKGFIVGQIFLVVNFFDSMVVVFKCVNVVVGVGLVKLFVGI